MKRTCSRFRTESFESEPSKQVWNSKFLRASDDVLNRRTFKAFKASQKFPFLLKSSAFEDFSEQSSHLEAEKLKQPLAVKQARASLKQ